MTSAVVPPASAPSAVATISARTFGVLAVGGVASLGAGAIHAAAVGVHNEHRQAVIAFTVTAMFQIGWGAWALVRPSRLVAAIGAVGNLAVIGGWAMAKTNGIAFIDGLDESESLQFADALAAGFAAVAVIAAAVTLLGFFEARSWSSTSRVLAGGFGTGIAVVSLFGMVSAGSHSHASGHGTEAAGHHDATATATAGADHHDSTGAGAEHDSTATGADHGSADHSDTPAAAVPPKVYDPALPIDLGGVKGVTLQEQAKAENMIAITLERLPQFADWKAAEAKNFHSIGDGFTGYEHFINWTYIDDGKILDPDYPEALVYATTPEGKRTLVSAMFMLGTGETLDTVPDLGGKLTQWHIHDDLCFSKDPTAPVVAGITTVGGACPANLQKFQPVPMIHVWITKHPCGPFAALEGVGAGQVKAGETKACDHAHGA